MRDAAFLLLLAVTAPVLAADIYRRPDRGAGVEFSDQPDPAAERIILREPVVVPLPGYPEPSTTAQTQRSATKLSAGKAYAQFRVLEPADDAVVRTDDGTVVVQVLLIPPLQVALGHALSLSLDGNPLQAAEGQGSFTLTEVAPGTHQLQATVSASDGSPLLTSPVSRFHVLRHTIRPQKSPPGTKPKPAD